MAWIDTIRKATEEAQGNSAERDMKRASIALNMINRRIEAAALEGNRMVMIDTGDYCHEIKFSMAEIKHVLAAHYQQQGFHVERTSELLLIQW